MQKPQPIQQEKHKKHAKRSRMNQQTLKPNVQPNLKGKEIDQTENLNTNDNPTLPFFNPICQQTYKALPRIYGCHKKKDSLLNSANQQKIVRNNNHNFRYQIIDEKRLQQNLNNDKLKNRHSPNMDIHLNHTPNFFNLKRGLNSNKREKKDIYVPHKIRGKYVGDLSLNHQHYAFGHQNCGKNRDSSTSNPNNVQYQSEKTEQIRQPFNKGSNKLENIDLITHKQMSAKTRLRPVHNEAYTNRLSQPKITHICRKKHCLCFSDKVNETDPPAYMRDSADAFTQMKHFRNVRKKEVSETKSYKNISKIKLPELIQVRVQSTGQKSQKLNDRNIPDDVQSRHKVLKTQPNTSINSFPSGLDSLIGNNRQIIAQSPNIRSDNEEQLSYPESLQGQQDQNDRERKKNKINKQRRKIQKSHISNRNRQTQNIQQTGGERTRQRRSNEKSKKQTKGKIDQSVQVNIQESSQQSSYRETSAKNRTKKHSAQNRNKQRSANNRNKESSGQSNYKEPSQSRHKKSIKNKANAEQKRKIQRGQQSQQSGSQNDDRIGQSSKLKKIPENDDQYLSRLKQLNHQQNKIKSMKDKEKQRYRPKFRQGRYNRQTEENNQNRQQSQTDNKVLKKRIKRSSFEAEPWESQSLIQKSKVSRSSDSASISSFIFQSNNKKNTQFHNLNRKQQSFSNISPNKSLNKSVLSNGLFRIPQQDQYVSYISNYKPINKQFKIKQIAKRDNFQVVPFNKGVFFGQVHNQMKHGEGLLLSQKQIFQGKFNNNVRYAGCERNVDGIYKGDYLNGKRSGHGVFEWNNGEVYEGQWKDGTKNGHGIWKSPKGDFYQGQWLLNRQHGKGVFKHRTSTYRGQFKDFLKHGKGQQKFSNGDRYEGQYFQGKPHGKGIYEWSQGGYYIGSFANGMRQGEGKWVDVSGNVYEGAFKNDFKHGQGVQIFKTGQRFEGIFNEGVQQKGRIYGTDGCVIQVK